MNEKQKRITITRLLAKSLKDFYYDDGAAHAAAIAYSATMTIVPFCLLMVAVFGYILGSSEQILQVITKQLTSLFPSTGNEILEGITVIISHRSIGKLTLLIYLIFAFQLFLSIQSTTNIIFKETKRRSPVKSAIIALSMITLITTAIVASFLATSAISILKEYLPHIKVNTHASILISYAMPLVLLFIITTAFYKMVPIRTIPYSAIMPGAAFTAVLFELAKHAFTFYMLQFPTIGIVYGSLWAFFLFLTWTYYSACVYLIGAEIVHNLDTNGNTENN